MGTTIDELTAVVRADTSGFMAGMDRVERGLHTLAGSVDRMGSQVSAGFHSVDSAVRRTEDQVRRSGGGILDTLSKFGNVLTGVRSAAEMVYGTVSGLVQAASGPVELAAKAEQAQVAFTTMLGSAEDAAQLIANINKFAAETPFETPELVQSSKSLLAFGVEANQIIPTMRMLGDLASGLNIPLNELSSIYGKMLTQGKIQAEDINQLGGRGIPIIKALAEQFGVAESEVRQMVSDGKVGFPEIQKALADMTGEGGRFQGMMAAQSQTLSGLWSTASDNIVMALTDIGRTIVESFDLKGVMSGSISFTEAWTNQFLPEIKAAILSVKPYFQALMTFVSTAWETYGQPFVQGVFSFFRNWDVYLEIAAEQFRLFLNNSLDRAVHFFTVNIPELTSWFLKHWKEVVSDLGQLLWLQFKNRIENISNLWSNFINWLAGNESEYQDLKSPFEGFESSITELPELTGAAVQESSAKLDELYAKLAQGEAEFAVGVRNSEAGGPIDMGSGGPLNLAAPTPEASTLPQDDKVSDARDMLTKFFGDLTESMNQFEMSAQGGFDGLFQRANALFVQFQNGELSLSDYRQALSALDEETKQITANTKAEIEAKQREALLKGDFKGAGLDFQKALQDRLAQFRMQQFNQSVEMTFNSMMGLNAGVMNVGSQFHVLQGQMSSFGQSMHQAVNPQEWQKFGAQLQETFNSVSGQLQLLYNNLALTQQKLQIASTYQQQKAAQDEIDAIQAQINNLENQPPPVFSPSNSFEDTVDPALQGKRGGGGGGTGRARGSSLAVNAYFPDVRSLGPAQISELFTMLQNEQARRGF